MARIGACKLFLLVGGIVKKKKNRYKKRIIGMLKG